MSWQKLATALIKGAVGTYAAYPVNVVLGYLIDQVVAQESELARLERKIDELLFNHFRVGRRFLEQAVHTSGKQ